MRVVTSLDRNIWKMFVDENPMGNIFHTPEMYDVFSRARGYQPALWATLGDHGQVLALFSPIQVSLLGGPLMFSTTRAVSYGGLLTAKDQIDQAALDLLLRTYNQRVTIWPIFTELRNITDPSGLHGVLQQNGYLFEDHLNYLIDLQRDPDDILKSFHRDAYRRIRRNLKRDVIKIQSITDRTKLSDFYALLRKTYQRAHVPLADFSLFEAAFDVLHPKNMVRFILATIDGAPVTASVSLLYKDVIYGWYTGSDLNYRSYGPNEFEVWELINWGIQNGYRILDFGGAGRPDEKYGVRDFKAKFNGELVNNGRYTLIHAPIRMKISEISYRFARNSMSVLGNMVAKPTLKKVD